MKRYDYNQAAAGPIGLVAVLTACGQECVDKHYSDHGEDFVHRIIMIMIKHMSDGFWRYMTIPCPPTLIKGKYEMELFAPERGREQGRAN